jgi:two-component system nitrogen regulation sensor histidine kinase NtrY
LIISFIILSLIPTVFLSVVASNLITQSIEGWFNVQIEHSLRESLEVAQAFYENSKKNSLYFAEQISEVLTDKRMLREVDTLHEFLRKKQQEFNLGLIEVYSTQGVRLARAVNPNVPIGNFDVYLADIVHVGEIGQQRAFTDSLGNGDLIKSIVPIHSKWEQEQIIGVLMVDYFVDGNLATKMQNIQGAFEHYKQIKIHKNPILGSYLLTFSTNHAARCFFRHLVWNAPGQRDDDSDSKACDGHRSHYCRQPGS